MSASITLYHGTNAVYDEIDPAMFGANPTAPANCHVGLWVARFQALAEKFGDRVHVFEADGEGIGSVRIDEWAKLHRDGFKDEDGGVARHHAYVARRRADGVKILAVEEMDGDWVTAVVIDIECLTRLKIYGPAPDSLPVDAIDAELVPAAPRF